MSDTSRVVKKDLAVMKKGIIRHEGKVHVGVN